MLETRVLSSKWSEIEEIGARTEAKYRLDSLSSRGQARFTGICLIHPVNWNLTACSLR